MTHPTAIHRFHDNEAVEAVQDGGRGGGAAYTGTAAPNLAAILSSYEEAKASIIELAGPAQSAGEGADSFPETVGIDVRAVALPAVPDAVAGTEAMSVAARSLAEESLREQGPPPATSSVPGASPDRRGWWRGFRAALHGVDPSTRPEA